MACRETSSGKLSRAKAKAFLGGVYTRAEAASA